MRSAKVLFGEFEGETVSVEGTDREVWGASWTDMNGNPCALEFAVRSQFRDDLSLGECLNKPVYYCKVGYFAKLFAERQLQFL